jgi:hypothetical protein
MSRQKAQTVKVTAKNTKDGIKFKLMPKRTGWVKLHIPDPYNDDISKCGMVKMVWSHLVCFPRRGDSMEELIDLRVCANCVRQSADDYHLTD